MPPAHRASRPQRGIHTGRFWPPPSTPTARQNARQTAHPNRQALQLQSQTEPPPPPLTQKPASSRTVARYVVCVTILVAANVGQMLGARFSASLWRRDGAWCRPWHPKPEPQSQSTSPVQSQKQKLANPLNDLLDEAQRDIDKNDFEAAIPPLQKFLGWKKRTSPGPTSTSPTPIPLCERLPEARADTSSTPSPSIARMYAKPISISKSADGEHRTRCRRPPPLRRAVELLPARSRPTALLGVAQERSWRFPRRRRLLRRCRASRSS